MLSLLYFKVSVYFQDAKLKIEVIERMLQNAIRGHDLRSSRQLLKEHKQLEEEAQELAEKINSIVTRAKHLATNHFDSQRILRETDTYLNLLVLIFHQNLPA